MYNLNEMRYIEDIELYIDSQPKNSYFIGIGSRNVIFLPDLDRFTELERLYCSNTQITCLPKLPNSLRELVLYCNAKLTHLPTILPNNLRMLRCEGSELTHFPALPNTLESLFCYNNKLTSLPELPCSLRVLYCQGNRLTSLPKLPDNIYDLRCERNQLTSIPALPKKLQEFNCSNNRLYLIPELPNDLQELVCHGNPLYELINRVHSGIYYGDALEMIKMHIKTLNRFRDLYYCLRFKTQFRRWLWERIREPKIQKQYHPEYLRQNLMDEDADLDGVLNEWIVDE